MIRILVSRQSRYPADTKALKKRVRSLLEKRGVTEVEVSIVLVGERKIRQLSKSYLGDEDGTHEVLSFPYLDLASQGDILGAWPEHDEFRLQLGDIVICYPEARKIAMKKEKMVDEVLQELAEHGTMHLLGIHHE